MLQQYWKNVARKYTQNNAKKVFKESEKKKVDEKKKQCFTSKSTLHKSAGQYGKEQCHEICNTLVFSPPILCKICKDNLTFCDFVPCTV